MPSTSTTVPSIDWKIRNDVGTTSRLPGIRAGRANHHIRRRQEAGSVVAPSVTLALRGLLGGQGLRADEDTPHLGHIGGDIRQAAAGVSPIAMQRHGRLQSDAVMAYVRASMDQVDIVSSTLARQARARGIQTGQTS